MRDEQMLEVLFRNVITELGEDVTRIGLEKTPKRMSKTINFLTSGYDTDINSIVNNALFPATNHNIVIVKDIEFYSLCEHHLLPFYGKCSIGYVPGKNFIGLSKLPRIVDMYARRLQLQERLTSDIAIVIKEVTDATGVIVQIEAKHLCMMMRGVEKQDSKTITKFVAGEIDQNTELYFYRNL